MPRPIAPIASRAWTAPAHRSGTGRSAGGVHVPMPHVAAVAVTMEPAHG